MNVKELIDKYNLTEEHAKAIVDEHKQSLEGFVPLSRLNQEIEKTKAEKARADEVESKIKELDEHRGTTEELVSKVEELNQKIKEEKEEYNKKVDSISKRSAVTLALLGKEKRPLEKALPTLLEAYDLESIKLDKDGNIVSGFNEQDERISEDFSFCYPQTAEAPKGGVVVKGEGEPRDASSSTSVPKKADLILNKLLKETKQK